MENKPTIEEIERILDGKEKVGIEILPSGEIRETKGEETPAINIILDEGSPPDVFFIEIELDNGRSINIGKRSKYGNFTKLRITTGDIENANKKEVTDT